MVLSSQIIWACYFDTQILLKHLNWEHFEQYKNNISQLKWRPGEGLIWSHNWRPDEGLIWSPNWMLGEGLFWSLKWRPDEGLIWSPKNRLGEGLIRSFKWRPDEGLDWSLKWRPDLVPIGEGLLKAWIGPWKRVKAWFGPYAYYLI